MSSLRCRSEISSLCLCCGLRPFSSASRGLRVVGCFRALRNCRSAPALLYAEKNTCLTTTSEAGKKAVVTCCAPAQQAYSRGAQF